MSHTENTPLLEVRNLKKYFGKKDRVLHAVDDISVTIQQGKTLGVVGESGCGKSTLGRTVLRLLEPTDGQIIFDGQDITHVSEREMRKYRQSMQIIFQDPYSSLNPPQIRGGDHCHAAEGQSHMQGSCLAAKACA